jgi:hypothetical protein
MKRATIILTLLICFQLISVAQSNINKQTDATLRTDWMKGKYGIMVHWLPPRFVADPSKSLNPYPAKGEYITDLNKAVDSFDLNRFLTDFDKTGAEWLIFTIGQNRSTYSSPNSVIDSLCGPGHTSKRDLVLEIAKAVKSRGKRFIAYMSVEINTATYLHKGFAWVNQPNNDQAVFQSNYLRAIKEWSLRYGGLCDGWWFDGCYDSDYCNFNNKHMRWVDWYEACRAGNPDAVLTFNDGSFCIGKLVPIRPEHDYTSGEAEVLIDGKIRLGRGSNNSEACFMPQSAYVQGTNCLYHALVPIDVNWGHRNPWGVGQNVPFKPVYPKKQNEMQLPVYSDTDLQNFVKDFTKVGGAVTLNLGIFQEGHLGKNSVKQIQYLSKVLHRKDKKQ